MPHRVFIPPVISARAPVSENPATPQRQKESTPPVTPASAKKRTLAKDILFALGMESRKRKSRSDDEAGSASESETVRKKLATQTLSTTDDERRNGSHEITSETIGAQADSARVTLEPCDSVFAELSSTSHAIDHVAAISAGVAQVVSEVQSSSSTPNEFIQPGGPRIIELSSLDNIGASEPEGATIVELPDDESEATVELGLTVTQPEAESHSRPSSARMSPIFDPIDESAGPLFLPSPEPEFETANIDGGRSTEAGPSTLPMVRNGKPRVFREVYVDLPPLPPWAGSARSIAEFSANTAPKEDPVPTPAPVVTAKEEKTAAKGLFKDIAVKR